MTAPGWPSLTPPEHDLELPLSALPAVEAACGARQPLLLTTREGEVLAYMAIRTVITEYRRDERDVVLVELQQIHMAENRRSRP